MNLEEKKRYPLKKMYFYLTEGCNLACRHCWISPKLQDETNVYANFPVELMKSIVKQAKPLGLDTIKLTGGEPLMHPRIGEILDFIKEQELKLNIESNGVLCTEELAEKISRCKEPFIAISVDGANAESHDWVRGIPGSFNATITAIKYLVKAGLKPQFIMSIMRHNKEQMEDVVRLAESIGAGSVKFNLIQPTGRGKKITETGESLTIEELVQLGKWVQHTLAPSTKLNLFYHQPQRFTRWARCLERVAMAELLVEFLALWESYPMAYMRFAVLGTTSRNSSSAMPQRMR